MHWKPNTSVGNPSKYRHRPPRLPVLFPKTGTPLHFVTFCTWDRQPILACDAVHQAFILAARKVQEAGNAVGRYVIMPDHVHFFLRIGPEGQLGLAVKYLRESITKTLRRTKPDLRLWHPGFFDHLMRSAESYSDKWEYVRQNPVRKGLAESAEEWPFQGEVVSLSM